MKKLILIVLTLLFLFSCEGVWDSYDPGEFNKIKIPLPKPSQDENSE